MDQRKLKRVGVHSIPKVDGRSECFAVGGERPTGTIPNGPVFHYDCLSVETSKAPEFLDITDAVQNLVQRSQVKCGLVNIQTRHTTTGLLVNENEALLFEDFERQLEATASSRVCYRHDQLELRREVTAHERRNGHAHCQAIALRSAETLNIVHHRLDLGRWQRLFLVELDTACRRTVSIMLMGFR